MKTFKVVLLLLLVGILLPGVTAADWDTYLGNDRNTAVGETPVLQNVTVDWSYKVSGDTASSPIVAEGRVYIGVMENLTTIDSIRRSANVTGTVLSLNSTTGERIWEAPTDGGVFSSSVYGDGRVYVTTLSGHVYAFDSETGRVVWEFDTEKPVFSSPKLRDGDLYFGTRGYNAHTRTDSEHYFYRLNTSDGSVVWKQEVERGVFGSAAISDGTVYVGDQNGTLHAFTAQTGKKVWRYRTKNTDSADDPLVEKGSVHTSPVLYQGNVYIGSYNGDIYAVDATTGQEEWRFRAETPVVGSPAVTNGTLYAGGYGGILYALDARNGNLVWKTDIGKPIDKSSPSIAEGVIYFGTGGISSQDGYLYAVSSRNGTGIWSMKTDSLVWSSPALADGNLFFTSMNKVYMVSEGSSGTNNSLISYSPDMNTTSLEGGEDIGSDTVDDGNDTNTTNETEYDTLEPLPNNQPTVPTVVAALVLAPILILASHAVFERLFN